MGSGGGVSIHPHPTFLPLERCPSAGARREGSLARGAPAVGRSAAASERRLGGWPAGDANAGSGRGGDPFKAVGGGLARSRAECVCVCVCEGGWWSLRLGELSRAEDNLQRAPAWRSRRAWRKEGRPAAAWRPLFAAQPGLASPSAAAAPAHLLCPIPPGDLLPGPPSFSPSLLFAAAALPRPEPERKAGGSGSAFAF